MNLRLRITEVSNKAELGSHQLPTEASLILPVLTLLLRWAKVRTVKRLLNALLRAPRKRQSPLKSQTVALMIEELCRNSWLDAQCLEESLLLWYMLRRQGKDVELKFGASVRGGQFAAHAWVEEQGQTVAGDSFDPQFHFRPLDI